MITVPVSRQIIDYVLAQATTVALAAGQSASQVHFLSTVETDVDALPDTNIWTVEDKPHPDEDDPDSAGGQLRVLTFALAISVKSLEEADTDTMAMNYRAAILQDPTLGGLALKTNWGAQEWGEGATATPTVSTKLTFTSTYLWSPEW